MFFQVLTAAEVDYWNGCLEKKLTRLDWASNSQFLMIPAVYVCFWAGSSSRPASLALCLSVSRHYLFLFGTHSLCGAEACHLVQLLPVLCLASVMKIFAQSLTYWDAGGKKNINWDHIACRFSRESRASWVIALFWDLFIPFLTLYLIHVLIRWMVSQSK